ncbi:MAG: efflux RND transporter periplasmic adaptor subunit [Hyphomicrobium sp.]|jgi:HlyD family secretion protein|nr:efflux RND transporter periplasmic adaptor subunit [Hyphomicrobium sp.]
MSKPLKYLFTLAIPLAIAGYYALGVLSPGGSGQSAMTYDTVVASKGQIRKLVSTSGPVRALVTVSVGSQLSGQVEMLAADYNSEVKAGDVLAKIDDRSFAAKVSQARADLAAARAALLNQQAALIKAKAVLDLAERTAERQKSLQSKGYSATATLDSANRDVAVGNAEIEVAKAQIESASAVITQREAALKLAEVDLERTKIVSPINGTVISRSIDLGQTVAASFQAPELFKIAQDLRLIRIEAQVNEADVGSVAEGNPVTFSVDAYPDRMFEGKVTQVRLSSTELQNIVTYTVIIEAANDDRKLFPGMTANVQIAVAEKDDVLRIPSDALRFKPRGETAEGDRGGQGKRGERQVARLKDDLLLTDAQEQAVRAEINKLFAARNAGPGGVDTSVSDPQAMRQKMQAAIEQTLGPLLTEEQRPLFEKWKRGRENTKSGAVHVLDATNTPERRFVRLGISDDQFTEVIGGQLLEGDRVIVRGRDTRK